MGNGTAIEWTDATWNPVRGCSRVSQGCVNCYAERVARRFAGPGQPYEGLTNEHGRWNGTVRLVSRALDQPSRWRKPRRIFVNSMSDLFHEALSFEDILGIFQAMALPECVKHTFQVLTKRPERMAAFMAWAGDGRLANQWPWDGQPLDNVWLGVSVEDQATADERIPHLLRVPARVRFLSMEPLLGPVDLTACAPYTLGGDEANPGVMNAFNGLCFHPLTCVDPPRLGGTADGIQWVIAGGESGPNARPMHPQWARSLRDQCAGANVPFFFKQWGEWADNPSEGGRDFVTMHEDPRHNERNIVTWACSCRMASMARAGKARAGRMLDGRVWDEMPPTRVERAV